MGSPARRQSFEVTPSGGVFDLRVDRYCVHPQGDAHNAIKHVPYEVAKAIAGYLNGEPASRQADAMARFILEKHGHLGLGEIVTIRGEVEVDTRPLPPLREIETRDLLGG